MLVLSYSLTIAQDWQPVGEGITCTDKVFAQGEWGVRQDSLHLGVYALCVYNNKLYAGGLFNKAGKISTNNIASWNGVKWDSLGAGTNGNVESFGIHKNLLIIGGSFGKAGGKMARGVVKWVDTLHTVPHFYYYQRGVYKLAACDNQGKKTYDDYYVNTISDFKGLTYLGGEFAIWEDGPFRGLCFWNQDKTTWDAVQGKATDSIKSYVLWSIRSFSVYKDKLYVLVYGTNYSVIVFVWDGDHISKSPNLPNIQGYFDCTATSDSDLYFAGIANYNPDKNATGNPKYNGILRLNNNSYTIIDGLPPETIVNAMVFYNNKLYVAGKINKINGKTVNNIACWDGKNWQPLGNGLTSSNKREDMPIKCLCIYNGYLYAGGNFDHSGSKEILNIAKYNLTPEGER